MEKYEIKKLFEYRLASEWAEYIEVFNINFNGVSVFAIADADKDDGLFNDAVFYQTRFDMAAQCNCPCTMDPTFL